MKTNPSLYGADKLECDMSAIGFVRSPNNIHALPSVHWLDKDPLKGASPIWYAGSMDIWEPGDGIEIQVQSDRIRLFALKFFGEPFSKRSCYDTVTIAVFETVEQFQDWCKVNGRLSLPGLPAYIHGD